jgi:hypothetical protein
MADKVATLLRADGYDAEVDGNADSFNYTKSVVYAPADLQNFATEIGQTLRPATITQIGRLPGTLPGITVIVGSSFTGQHQQPSSGSGNTSSSNTSTVTQQQIQTNVKQDLARWQRLAAETSFKIMMPTVWSPGMVYACQPHSYDDSANFRAYKIGSYDAVCVVGSTGRQINPGFWHIEETTWTNPPILSDPNEVRTINGQQYMLFYQNDRLYRVAFERNGVLYWVTNSLDEQLSDQLMLALATSMVPVK